MKWSEVERSRVSYFESRRYSPITLKNRRRYPSSQDTKERIGLMHHQYHANCGNFQGGRNRSTLFFVFFFFHFPLVERLSKKEKKKIEKTHAQTKQFIKRKEIEASLLPVGSIGSNGSGQGWSTQVEELAEHLADFDGSLSALAASDLATAVASYSMR